jgi:hypothetical protein
MEEEDGAWWWWLKRKIKGEKVVTEGKLERGRRQPTRRHPSSRGLAAFFKARNGGKKTITPIKPARRWPPVDMRIQREDVYDTFTFNWTNAQIHLRNINEHQLVLFSMVLFVLSFYPRAQNLQSQPCSKAQTHKA